MDIFLEFEQDTQKIQKKIKVGKNIIQKNINEIIKDNNSIIIPLINLKNIYNLNYKLVFISFTVSVSILDSQPDSNFDPFDWVLYKGSGPIKSISEGFTYIYLGTERGGVKRFNMFGNYFDDPITTAQGLESNEITAIHFDKSTGFIWVSSLDHIQYSFSREGDWYPISLKSIGLSNSDKITQIGSSSDYIWLKARSSYVKLDHSSGILIGIYPYPDDINIIWSSEKYKGQNDIKDIISQYTILDGWIINGDELINRIGRRVQISSGLISQHGDVYLGSEDGTIFHGTKTMETFSPIFSDIFNTDVSALYNQGNYLWIGSQNFIQAKGISKLDMSNLESFHYLFEETINMYPTPIYSLYHTGKELYAGGNDLVLYYNSNKGYWRTLDESQGVPGGIVWDLCATDFHLWIGSSKGIKRMDIGSNFSDQIGIEQYFDQIPVYDIENIENEIWIGASSGLFIYSYDNPKLMRATDFKNKRIIRNFNKITSIKRFNNDVYVAGRMGIAKFNIDEKEWDNLVLPGIYRNEIVQSMAINEKFIFLGTREGLTRINKRTGLVRDYNYNFIGGINDIFLEESLIWLGTTNGLVKFKWKKDL